MKLRRNQARLFSHDRELLFEAIQKIFDLVSRHQKRAHQHHRAQRARFDPDAARIHRPGQFGALPPANGTRVRISIPNGIEFEIAEIGSASTKGTGAIALNLKDSYGQFNRMHVSGNGLIRSRG